MQIRRILLSLVLLLAGVGVAVTETASPASAEPQYTFYRCYDKTDGSKSTIRKINQCPYGTIVVFNSYTDRVQAQIDGWCADLEASDGASKSQIVSRCINRHVGLTTAQLLTIAQVAITCYRMRTPRCLLPLLSLVH